MLDGGRMKKRFNVTGLCIPSIHYMVDTDKKIEYIIEKYVEEGAYFTINRARQYGRQQHWNYYISVYHITILYWISVLKDGRIIFLLLQRWRRGFFTVSIRV